MVCRKASLNSIFCIDGRRIRKLKRRNPQFLLLGVILALQLTNQCHGSDDRRRPPPPPPPETLARRVDRWSQRPKQEGPNSYTSSGTGLDQPFGGLQKDLPDTSTASWYTEINHLDQQGSPYTENTDIDHPVASDWYNNNDASATQSYPYRDPYSHYDNDEDTNQQNLPSKPMARNAATSGIVAGVSENRPRNIIPQTPIHYEFPISREAAKDQERKENEDENSEITS
jgi:hypothetical protein